MNRFYSICKFLFVLCLISREGLTQSPDSLMAQQNYGLAAVLYEKQIFELTQSALSEDSLRQTYNQLLTRKIQAQKSERSFEDAWQTAQRFDLSEPDNSIAFRMRYETILCGYLAQHYNETYGLLQQTKFYTQDSLLSEALQVVEILTLNELERWTESKAVFQQYAARKGLNINADELYKFLKKKPKNPDKAQLLSFLMPGLGQVYAGYPKAGIVSLGLQAIALGFGVYHVWHKYYFIGFFTGAGMFQTFYFGGGRRAAIMAETTNKKRKAANNQRIRTVVIGAETKKGSE